MNIIIYIPNTSSTRKRFAESQVKLVYSLTSQLLLGRNKPNGRVVNESAILKGISC